MFFSLPDSARDEVGRVEALLQEHNPWPQSELAKLSKLAADTPDGAKRFAEFRRFVLDVEQLVQDLWWAMGNSLLILRAFPDVSKPLSDVEEKFRSLGIPSRVPLLIGSLVAGRDRILFEDPLERHSSGDRVGAWMIRTLTDHSVGLSVAILDRLAHLLILAADVEAPRDRMYFRSGKLSLVRDESEVDIQDSLMRLAESEDLEFLINYRDGFAHTMRLNTSAMGAASVDHYFDSDGGEQTLRSVEWVPAELLGISIMGFELVREGIREVTSHCERILQPEKPRE